MTQNESPDTSAIVRRIAEAYGPSRLPVNPPSPLPVDEYSSPVHPASQAAFERLFQSARRPVIPEDATWIRDNLARAAKPLTWQEQLMREHLRRQDARRDQALQAQIDANRAQAELAEAQLTALRYQQWEAELAKRKPPTLPDRKSLNECQELLNRLFKGEVFDRTEMQYPYDLHKGRKVSDRNIAQMAAVADWILFHRQTNGDWSDDKVRSIAEFLLVGDRSWISPEQERQLEIARRLNNILKRNEAINSRRDDAKAFAEGMRVLIEANTHGGKADERQLIEDLKFFMIDQSNDFPVGWAVNQLTEFHPSNAAYNLMGGPRLGTIGWKQKYWDQGRQFDENGNPINQTHHFAASLIDTLRHGPEEARIRAYELDRKRTIGPITVIQGNPQDIVLSRAAIRLADSIKKGEIFWKDLPEEIYQELKEKITTR